MPRFVFITTLCALLCLPNAWAGVDAGLTFTDGGEIVGPSGKVSVGHGGGITITTATGDLYALTISTAVRGGGKTGNGGALQVTFSARIVDKASGPALTQSKDVSVCDENLYQWKSLGMRFGPVDNRIVFDVDLPSKARPKSAETYARVDFYKAEKIHLLQYNLSRNLIENSSFEQGIQCWNFCNLDDLETSRYSDNPVSGLATNCSQLKMELVGGKNYLTGVADTVQLLRLIQPMPSPKTEPSKKWLAKFKTFASFKLSAAVHCAWAAPIKIASSNALIPSRHFCHGRCDAGIQVPKVEIHSLPYV